MAFCPKCRFEYVDGIDTCPDCKVKLVDSLEPSFSEEEMSEEEMASIIRPYVDEAPDEDEREEMLERARNIIRNPSYKPVSEQYEDNRSGSGVLLVCGVLGVLILVLNSVGVINVPLKGFSLTLMYLVMGCLFFVFLVSGVLSIRKMKILKPEVQREKELIDSVLEFIKAKKEDGTYVLNKDDNYELNYLALSEKVVADVEANFEDLETGFAFYVVDRFANEILDED